jgi:hypothetical protein
MKKIFALIGLFFSITAFSPSIDKEHWYLLDRENGCVPFDEGTPTAESDQVKTPTQILNYLRSHKLENAEMKPFPEYIAEEMKASGRKQSPEEYRHFTNANSFIITSRNPGAEIVVVSQKLCEAMKLFSK